MPSQDVHLSTHDRLAADRSERIRWLLDAGSPFHDRLSGSWFLADHKTTQKVLSRSGLLARDLANTTSDLTAEERGTVEPLERHSRRRLPFPEEFRQQALRLLLRRPLHTQSDPTRASRLRETAQQLALRRLKGAELVKDFVAPLALEAVADVLAVDREHGEGFIGWGASLVAYLGLDRYRHEVVERALASLEAPLLRARVAAGRLGTRTRRCARSPEFGRHTRGRDRGVRPAVDGRNRTSSNSPGDGSGKPHAPRAGDCLPPEPRRLRKRSLPHLVAVPLCPAYRRPRYADWRLPDPRWSTGLRSTVRRQPRPGNVPEPGDDRPHSPSPRPCRVRIRSPLLCQVPACRGEPGGRPVGAAGRRIEGKQHRRTQVRANAGHDAGPSSDWHSRSMLSSRVHT